MQLRLYYDIGAYKLKLYSRITKAVWEVSYTVVLMLLSSDSFPTVRITQKASERRPSLLLLCAPWFE